MTTTDKLAKKLEKLYNVTGIPVSIITDITSFRLLYPKTEMEPDLDQHTDYLSKAIEEFKLPLYTPLVRSIFMSTFYCILRISDNILIQLGPVASHEINFTDYISRLKPIYPKNILSFHLKLLQGAPKVDLNYFLNIVILMTDLLCDKEINIDQMVIDINMYSENLRSKAQFYDRSSLSIDQLSFQDEIYHIIQTGNVKKLNELQAKNHLSSLIYFQENDIYFLRMAFMFYGGIICHYAVLGGLDSKTVQNIFENYLSKLDEMAKPETFWSILPEFSKALCVRVQELQSRKRHSELLQKCIDYIEHNIYTNLSIVELEQITQCSRRTILRHFKEYLNTTPSDYITDEKCKTVCDLLTNSKLSIVEISSLLNYSSQSHLTRVFSQKYGCTPLQYRTKHMK